MRPRPVGYAAGEVVDLGAVAGLAGVSESTVYRVLRGNASVREATRLRVEAAIAKMEASRGHGRAVHGQRFRRLATISDVADLAGVSEATVSRVVNRGQVREATRRLVESAIEKLDYHPDPVARSLSRGATMALGIIAPFLLRPSSVERIRGAEAEFTRAGYQTELYNIGTPGQVREQFRSLARRRTDGILVVSLLPAHRDMERLIANGTPVVVVDARYSGLPQVYVDDVEGGSLATRHLLELGHRRIAFIGDFTDNPYGFTSSARRRAGFAATMRRAGLTVAPCYVKEGEHSRDTALALASELLALPEPPTAIFAASDTQAFGVLEAALQRGVAVPQQLSVIGFDDVEVAAYLSLTTVRQPLEYSGARGARLLLELATRRPSRRPVVEKMPLELVVRRTTAPAP